MLQFLILIGPALLWKIVQKMIRISFLKVGDLSDQTVHLQPRPYSYLALPERHAWRGASRMLTEFPVLASALCGGEIRMLCNKLGPTVSST